MFKNSLNIEINVIGKFTSHGKRYTPQNHGFITHKSKISPSIKKLAINSTFNIPQKERIKKKKTRYSRWCD